MALPASYFHWQRTRHHLLEPLAALMRPGHADLAIAGPASDHDRLADHLKSFARLGSSTVLDALFWTGHGRADSAPWQVGEGTTGHWRLSHPRLGTREIKHWSLPILRSRD